LEWVTILHQTHPIHSVMTGVKSPVPKSMELWTTQKAEGHFGQLAVWKISSIIMQVCIRFCIECVLGFKKFCIGFCIRVFIRFVY
jgi:hypothetical protein